MPSKNKEITLESIHTLITTKFDHLEKALDRLETKIANLEERITSLEKKVLELEESMISLEYRTSNLETAMTKMQHSIDFVKETMIGMNRKFEGEFEKVYIYTNSRMDYVHMDLSSHTLDLARIKTKLNIRDEDPSLKYLKKKGSTRSK